jgi:hypothetical protein
MLRSHLQQQAITSPPSERRGSLNLNESQASIIESVDAISLGSNEEDNVAEDSWFHCLDLS